MRVTDGPYSIYMIDEVPCLCRVVVISMETRRDCLGSVDRITRTCKIDCVVSGAFNLHGMDINHTVKTEAQTFCSMRLDRQIVSGELDGALFFRFLFVREECEIVECQHKASLPDNED